jgi:hypothetical protein
MGSDADRFIYKWLYDVQHELECALYVAKYDLLDGDEAEQKKAAEKVVAILGELSPPRSAEARQQLAEAVMRDESITAAEKIARVDAILNPKQKRGRPRTETVQQAIRALSMHRAGHGDWRTIALKVRGCNHFERSETKSCKYCGEAIAQSVRRLEKVLRKLGIDHKPENAGGGIDQTV